MSEYINIITSVSTQASRTAATIEVFICVIYDTITLINVVASRFYCVIQC